MWYLDTDTMLFVLSLISILGFFLGHAMHGVLEDEGFGPYGNMSVIMAGFIGGIFAMSHLGLSLRDVRMVAAGGLIGAFSVLAALVMTKNVLHRLGY